jgi:hypothetical protein
MYTHGRTCTCTDIHMCINACTYTNMYIHTDSHTNTLNPPHPTYALIPVIQEQRGKEAVKWPAGCWPATVGRQEVGSNKTRTCPLPHIIMHPEMCKSNEYIYVSTCACTCIYVHTYIYTYMCTYTYIHAHVQKYTYIHMYVHIQVHIYTCKYTYMYININIRIHIRVAYMYTWI